MGKKGESVSLLCDSAEGLETKEERDGEMESRCDRKDLLARFDLSSSGKPCMVPDRAKFQSDLFYLTMAAAISRRFALLLPGRMAPWRLICPSHRARSRSQSFVAGTSSTDSRSIPLPLLDLFQRLHGSVQ